MLFPCRNYLSQASCHSNDSFNDFHSNGDFDMRVTDSNFQAFYESHDLYNLIKEKTCFKSIQGTCIDLILTNQSYSFKNLCTMDTGVSDFHGMVFNSI